MNSCAEDEYRGWFRYHGIHFGWYGTDAKDPTKTRQRAFRCIKKENRSKGIVEQDCPACDLIDTQRKAFDDLKARLKAAGKSDDEIKTEAGPLEDWLGQYNLDFKCYVNVMNPANEFGDLKLNHKFHKKALDVKFAQLWDQKIDPLALEQGVWIEINRTTGDGNDAVEIVQEPFVMEGRTFYRPKEAPLDEALSNRALEECVDLNEIGFQVTYEQIKAIVESPGEPEDIDRIFAMSQKADTPTQPSRQSAPAPQPTPAPAPSATKPVGGPPAPVAEPANKVLNPNDPAVQARLATIRAKKEAEAKLRAEAERSTQKAQAAAKPAPAEDPTAGMSDEEFLAFAGGEAK